MPEEVLEDLSADEFDALLAGFIGREDDRIEPSVFLKAVAELEGRPSQGEVELAGRLVNGDVIFDTPSPLPVGTNTLYVGGTRVTLRLRVGDDQGSGRE